MYKVFFNDRIVFLNTSCNVNNVENEFIVAVDANSELLKIFLDFVDQDKFQHLVLWNPDLNYLKERFFANFKNIAAAGGVVFNGKQELLCIHRLGKWDLPKGKVEKNEDIEQAAIREVEEECSISKPKIIGYFDTTYHLYQNKFDQEKWVLKPTYWYQMEYLGSESPKPQLKEAIEKVQWVSKMEIDIFAASTYASLKPIFLKAITCL